MWSIHCPHKFDDVIMFLTFLTPCGIIVYMLPGDPFANRLTRVRSSLFRENKYTHRFMWDSITHPTVYADTINYQCPNPDSGLPISLMRKKDPRDFNQDDIPDDTLPGLILPEFNLHIWNATFVKKEWFHFACRFMDNLWCILYEPVAGLMCINKMYLLTFFNISYEYYRWPLPSNLQWHLLRHPWHSDCMVRSWTRTAPTAVNIIHRYRERYAKRL